MAINATDEYGRTALHRAAYRGSIERLKQLITTDGMNINATDKDGMTPMHWAAEQGNAKCLKALLTTVGVDVHVIDNLARTPRDIVLASVLDTSKVECWELMKLVNHGMKPLHWAAFQGNTQYLKQLVADSGVNINATDEDSKTALHWAAFQGNIAGVKVLIAVDGVNSMPSMYTAIRPCTGLPSMAIASAWNPSSPPVRRLMLPTIQKA